MTDGSSGIAARRRRWQEVVNEGDVDAYADLVTEDVVWLPPGGSPIQGRNAFRLWLEPFFARYAYRFAVEPARSRTWDGWCAEHGRFVSVLQEKSGGAEAEHGGSYFVLWRREPDDLWRIERYVDGVIEGI